MSSEDIGYILGAVLIPGLLIWWGVRLRERKSRFWAIPITLGPLFLLAAIPNLVDRFESSTSASVAQVSPKTAFAPISGYEFIAAPEAETSGTENLRREMGDAFIDVAARDIESSEGVVASALAVTVDPKVIDIDFLQDMANGLTSEGGGASVPNQIEGQFVVTVSTEDPALEWIVWQRPRTNLFVLVLGEDAADVNEIVRAMLAVQTAAGSSTN